METFTKEHHNRSINNNIHLFYRHTVWHIKIFTEKSRICFQKPLPQTFTNRDLIFYHQHSFPIQLTPPLPRQNTLTMWANKTNINTSTQTIKRNYPPLTQSPSYKHTEKQKQEKLTKRDKKVSP